MQNLLQSRRFWTGVVGAISTLLIYFIGKYFAASLEDVQVVLNVVLPIVMLLIVMFTVDDVTNTWARSQVEMKQIELATIQNQVQLETLRLTQSNRTPQ